MPRIPVYENKNFPNAGPMSEAAAGAAKTGYYIGQMWESGFKSIGRGISKAQADYDAKKRAEQEHEEQQDISNLSVAVAMKQAELVVKGKRAIAAGETADSYLEGATSSYEELRASAKTERGRQFIAKHIAEGYGSLWTSLSADEMEITTETAVTNFETVINAYSAAASEDPANLKSYLAQANHTIDALVESHNMPKDKAEELRKNARGIIARSNVKGMIQRNPEAAKEAMAKGEFTGLLDGEELFALNKTADERIDAIAADKKAAAEIVKKERTEAANKAMNDIQENIKVGPDGKMEIPADFNTVLDKWNDEHGVDAAPGTYIAAKKFAAAELRRNNKSAERPSDPTVSDVFIQKSVDGTLTPEEVLNARAQGFINTKDFKYYYKKAAEPAANNAEQKSIVSHLNTAKNYIMISAVSKSLRDTWGASRLSEYKADMLQQWEEAKASGMSLEDFKKYATTEISRYTFSRDEIMAEGKRLGKAGTLQLTPPTEIEPSPLPKNLPKGTTPADFFSEHSMNSAPEQVRNIVAASRREESLPIIEGTQSGRQALDMSNMNPLVLSKFERVQGILGYQVPVVSAYRDTERNEAAGGKKQSAHLRGDAIDISVVGLDIHERLRLIETASAMGFTGIGVGKTSIHLDVGRRRVWGYPDIPGWATEAIANHSANKYGSHPLDDFGGQG